MPARTRCSPAVSLWPSFSSWRPRLSCTAARRDHAAHQSSQRSSALVTSSKSASSTPFETKRGSQCEMAEATRASLATDAPDQEPDPAYDGEDREYEEADHSATCAAVPETRCPGERRLIGRALEEELAADGPRRRAVFELGEALPAAARERRQPDQLQELGEPRLLDGVRPHGGARPGLVVADDAAEARIRQKIDPQQALAGFARRGGRLAIGKERPGRLERHAHRASRHLRRAGRDLEGGDLPLLRDIRLVPLHKLGTRRIAVLLQPAVERLCVGRFQHGGIVAGDDPLLEHRHGFRDRKSTRLNSSHLVISYAVFCLKKKKKILRRQNKKTHNLTHPKRSE